MRKASRCLICFILIWGAFPAAGAYAQTEREKKAEAYQNRQRAFNLSLLKGDIKLIDDAPERCFLRSRIAEFIFEKKVADYYDTAGAFALECLDETVDNAGQFSGSQSGWWKNRILSLLRKYSPELAAKAEKKYFANDSDSDLSDELNAGKDPNGVADRLISRIGRGGVSPEIVSIIFRLKTVNNSAALRLLGAVLSFYETNYEKAYTDDTFESIGYYYPDPATPGGLKNRFYNFILRLGEAAIAQPQNDELSRLSIKMFELALPSIKQDSPDSYPKASAIYLSLSSKKSKYENERDEVLARIRDSKDKLAQTISEAESAQNKELKNDLWLYASQSALDEKKYRLAAGLRMKIDIEDKKFQFSQAFFLIENILPSSLKENDFDSAEYIVGLVEDPGKKSEGIFKIVIRQIELKNRGAAFDKLNEGLKIIEKTDAGPAKIRIALSAIPIALKIDRSRAFDIAGDAIKVINRLPSPGPDDRLGTEERIKYVTEILQTVSYNLDGAFRVLGRENMALADPVSQGLQLKEWRLVTQIALETERLYPLPSELEHPGK